MIIYLFKRVSIESKRKKLSPTTEKIRKVGNFIKYIFNIGIFIKLIIEFLTHTRKN